MKRQADETISGTLTHESIVGIPPVPVCAGGPEDISNMCGSQPKLNKDGTVDGDTIFVRTNCATREPLPLDKQDPVYQKPGVPLDRGQVASILSKGSQKNTCDYSYKFFFGEFELRGKAWTDNQLGNNGENLLNKLRECGVVSEWKFEWTPNDPNFEWYSYGRLPIGNKNCVGDKVTAVGGPDSTRGNCNGSG